MFGSIKRIDGNEITVENLNPKIMSNIMNCHVVFDDNERKIVGELVFFDDQIVKILLVGEIINGAFIAGVIRKPSNNSTIRIIDQQELELILGKNEFSYDRLYLGKSVIYKDFNISVPLKDFFSNHTAILGNTGSGKSCSVARVFQNLFFINPYKPVNAHILLFDAYGEYANTFNQLNSMGMNFLKFNSGELNTGEKQLKFPAYFLDVDDLAILLQVSTSSQIPVLDKALKLVRVFKSTDEGVKQYKNNIIANCLRDILTSGKSSTQIRDQIIAVLSNYNTDTLNLNSVIHQVGYDRTLRQCLIIDNQGKMNAISEVNDYLQKFEKVNLDNIPFDATLVYNLDDIFYALEFALISEGILNSDIAYEKNNVLKTRLQYIINSEKNDVFSTDAYISKENFVRAMFNNTQVVNVNLTNFEDRFAKIITKLFSKLIFNYTTNNKPRASFSVNIVLEEAHRYVQNDTDTDIIGYNIFDRITKEGRKYGTLLTFITQRPSELSETALSQCSNFIVLKIYHPKDLNIVKNMSTNMSESTLSQVKSLQPGNAIVFGSAFKIPVIVEFDLPDPLPESTSVDIDRLWFNQEV